MPMSDCFIVTGCAFRLAAGILKRSDGRRRVPDEPRHLGELLRKLRTRLGLDFPAGAAKLIGVSDSYAYWLESGWASPKPTRLQHILDKYEATDEERSLAWVLRARAPSRPRGSLRNLDPMVVATKQGRREAPGSITDDEEDVTEERAVPPGSRGPA